MTPKKDVGNLFRRKRFPTSFFSFALVLAAGEVAFTCPICFRVEENATTHGMQAAVLVLVGVTTVVLGAFARFVVGFVRRERRTSKEEEADKC